MKNFLSFLMIILLSQGCAESKPPPLEISKIVVHKGSHMMALYQNEQPYKLYKVSLGQNPLGHKVMEGDKRTPEGTYKISGRNENSSFYRSLRISYPNDDDIANAKKRGVNPGGDIMIHGLPNGHYNKEEYTKDWTAGCIAVNDTEIDEIWQLVKDGTDIEIMP